MNIFQIHEEFSKFSKHILPTKGCPDRKIPSSRSKNALLQNTLSNCFDMILLSNTPVISWTIGDRVTAFNLAIPQHFFGSWTLFMSCVHNTAGLSPGSLSKESLKADTSSLGQASGCPTAVERARRGRCSSSGFHASAESWLERTKTQHPGSIPSFTTHFSTAFSSDRLSCKVPLHI